MVTVKAAVEYMKHANFDHLQNPKSKVQKEVITLLALGNIGKGVLY